MLIEILNQYSPTLMARHGSARPLKAGIEKGGLVAFNCPDEMDRWIDAPHDLPGV